MARVVELASGFPGYNATIPKENGFLSEILRLHGYATFAVGKWHLTPATEMSAGSPRDKWPLGRGFDRYYGFMGGETDQYHPELVRDNQPIEPPRTPEEGYHLTEDLADHAIRYLADLRGAVTVDAVLAVVRPGGLPCAAPGAEGLHRALPRALSTRGGTSGGMRCSPVSSASGLLPAGTTAVGAALVGAALGHA